MELADGTEECMFSVSDNGAGISEEDYVKIFERFYQVENIGQYGGTGIGLALSQGIVKAHQGDITVESQLGKGSCFKVTLKKGDAHFDSSVARVEPEQDKEYIYYSEDKEQDGKAYSFKRLPVQGSTTVFGISQQDALARR